MARQRRGGGFKPPELRGTLGTLLRTAAAQVGPLREALTDVVGDALERTAREGRTRLEDARARFEESREPRGRGGPASTTAPAPRFSRRARPTTDRSDALAELGEIVLDLIRRGEIDLGELPEVRDVVAHLDELDDDIPDDLHHLDDDRDQPPPSRSRFDARRRPSSDDDGTVSSRNWSPSAPSRAPAARPPSKPAPRVWRPPVDAAAPPDDEDDHRTQPSGPVGHARKPKDPFKKGGISFDEDDDSDLADYMHPDDVPAKKPPDSDS
jgi:hypothetical protein